jgi:PAS domain S-box-containing protein
MNPTVKEWSRGSDPPGHMLEAASSSWSALVLAAPLPMAIVALDGSAHVWNDAAAAALGWLRARSGVEAGFRHHPLWFRRLREAASAGRAPAYVSLRRRTKAGMRFVRLTANALDDGSGKTAALLLNIEDRTRFRKVEQELADGERRYRELLELSPEAIAIHDHERILYINPAGIDLIGAVHPDDVVGQPLLEFVHPDSRDLIRRPRRELESGARLSQLTEQKLLRLDGQAIDVEVVAMPIRYRRGHAVLLIVRDMTARKRAEAGLRASQERFRLLTEGVRDYAIIMLDPNGAIVSWNTGAERLTGFRTDEAIRAHFGKLFQEDESDAHASRLLEHAAKLGRYEEEGWRVRKDGTRFWASVAVTTLYDPAQNVVGYAKIVRDLTERREAASALRRSEDHLRQAQKMEGIGRLAGGIAHDFNNLLTAIQGHAQFLLEDLDPESGPFADAEEIKKAADRAATLTRQLLAFSRRQVLQPQVLDLNAVIGDMQKMLRRVIREDIDLITTLDDELWPVHADAGQMEQVLMNLVVNSRDAMPSGGTVTIQTSNVRVDRAFGSAGLTVRPGRYVQIAVTDSGIGMEREIQTKIFEPFFTTKPEGQGTGLGLATVYGIVKQSGGSISVYSELGRGTTFKVLIPWADDGTAADADALDGRSSELARGWEAVLIVEDDVALRTVTSKTLQDRGYSVLEAESGEEALRLAAEYDGPIDLVLADIIMPRMSGRRLAESLRSMQPAMRVLFMSGFTRDEVVRQGLMEKGAAFLEKPFGADKLAGKVREVLDGG